MASPFLHRTGILIRLLLFLVLWLLGLILTLAGLGLSPWGSQWLFEQAQQNDGKPWPLSGIDQRSRKLGWPCCLS